MDMATFLDGNSRRIRKLYRREQAVARAHDCRAPLIPMGYLLDIV